MPIDPSTPVNRRLFSPRIVRLFIGLLVAAALIVPAAALPHAEPVVAGGGGSCTGWNSTSRPPKTIRVLRSTGNVEVVDFKRYVVVVTAKEWPSYIPRAAIEAGAAAVKQYGWVKTLAGNHRASFVTSKGKCYDVVDGTRDQLYKPHLAKVTDNVRSAVDSIWGLSLRKDGRFFETGYRTGTSNRCGRDANGRLLYAKSVIDCARRGMSRQEIQFRYYGRSLTLHWTDGRVIGYKGQQAAAQATPKPAATPKPTPKPAATPKPTPKPAATPKPTPKAAAPVAPTPEPTPDLAGTALSLPQLGVEAAGDPASVLVWLPTAEAIDGTLAGDDPQVAMPTVYALPGTLLQLPGTGALTDGDTWLAVCATSVGALPVGEASYLELLPPPFGCAGGGSASAAGDLASGAQPVVARVYANSERAWVIY